MLDVRQQTSPGERDLPTLRTRLKRRYLWVAFVEVLAYGIVVDLGRDPGAQVGARIYVKAVRGYQHLLRPGLRSFVRCRYHPTCSEYSVEAVERYGLWKGAGLTVSRIFRCRTNVPLGKYDPIPGSARGPDAAE